MTPEALADANAALGGASPDEILDYVAGHVDAEAIVMSTSFGPNSGVLLHLVHRRFDGRVQVIFIDPGDIPAANRDYADALIDRLGLTVREFHPLAPMTEPERYILASGTDDERRAVYAYRKIEPMARAMETLGARVVLHGNRRDQGGERTALLPFSRHSVHGYLRAYPLLAMSSAEAGEYLIRHDLPVHSEGLPGARTFECGLHR